MCNKSYKDDAEEKIIRKLQSMEIDYDVAKLSVDKILNEYGEKQSYKFLLQQSVALALSYLTKGIEGENC